VSEPQQPILVVKLGGAEGLDIDGACADLAALARSPARMVVVHGGSADATSLGQALGQPARMLTSPSGFVWRYTDRATLETFTMAVNGKRNTLLVERLQAHGVNALGLSGLDGRLLVAAHKAAVQSVEGGRRRVIRDDFTGKVECVNDGLLSLLLAAGYLPVIAPLALSGEGFAVNVDADRAAAKVAAALQADTLLLLTAAPGLLSAFPDEATLIPELPRDRLEAAMAFAQGRMKKKILGAREALAGGVRRVIIADGRRPRPISDALAGMGTSIQ
jgi:acetylglutamate/LysW-gamma-L-alpha-aminoadipate kinase